MFKLQGTNASYTCKFLSLSYTTRITLCLTTCISWTSVTSHMLSVSMMIEELLSLFNNSVIDLCSVSVLPGVHACLNFASSYRVNSHLIETGSKRQLPDDGVYFQTMSTPNYSLIFIRHLYLSEFLGVDLQMDITKRSV